MSGNIHYNDIGVIFRVTLKYHDANGNAQIYDLSACTTLEIIFDRPDKTNVTKTASFYTDGTDGIITYTSIANDLNQVGKWQLYAHIIAPGVEKNSTPYQFDVLEIP